MSNETSAVAETTTRMPDYNRTLGFWDLFFIAVGVIIGSGIMVFTGRAIGMTGRSICLAYIGSAVWVICMGVPTILMCSCIRLIGGGYTQSNIFFGPRFGGFYLALYILGTLGHTLYAQTFALYFCDLIGGGNQTVVAIVMIVLFYIINFFGVDAMAKAQNAMSMTLLVALAWFTVRGLPKVNWSTFFGGEGWMTGGVDGLFRASTLLTYSLLGATSLMPYSAEAKNPLRDIPLAAAISTIGIAVLFSLMGVVCSGILPLEQVIDQSLSIIARHILTYPEYVFFMVGGALCAAATTLNGLIGSVTKPLVMMSHDGWLPRALGTLHPKYKTPYKYLIIYFFITIAPLLLGLNISQVTNMTLLGSYLQTTLFIFFMRNIPKKFPEQWEKSIFRLPLPVFNVIMVICFLASASNVWGMLKNSDMKTIITNSAVIAIGLVFSFVWYGSGKVTPSVSWENA